MNEDIKNKTDDIKSKGNNKLDKHSNHNFSDDEDTIKLNFEVEMNQNKVKNDNNFNNISNQFRKSTSKNDLIDNKLNESSKNNSKELLNANDKNSSEEKEKIVIKDNNYYDEKYGFSSVSLQIISLGGSLLFAQLIHSLRYLILFYFTRDYGLSQVAALTAVTTLISITSFGMSWALSQGYGFKSSELYGAKNYHELGRVTNKALFLNICAGIILGIILAFSGEPIFSLLVDDKEALRRINILFKLVSISIPFQFGIMVRCRYFLSIGYLLPLYISLSASILVEIICLAITLKGFAWLSYGEGFSFVIGTLSVCVWLEIIYLYKNPIPEVVVEISFSDIFDNFCTFFKFSLPLFILIFLTSISYELMSFLALLFGEESYSTYGVIGNLIGLSFIFSESVAGANNILINQALGEGNRFAFKRILRTSFILITIFVVFTTLIFILLYKNIILLFTKDPAVENLCQSLLFWVLVNNALLSFHAIIAETITAIGDENFPIYTMLGGRYIITVGMTFLLYSTTNIGLSIVLISSSIGQMTTIVINIFKLLSTLKEQGDLIEEIKEE